MSIKSTRCLTQEQFSEGTTIDGNRIDEALHDVDKRIKQIPKGDVRTRWLYRQIVLHHWPGTVDHYPFVRSYNDIEDVMGPEHEVNLAHAKTLEKPDYVIRNPYRTKGVSPFIEGGGPIQKATLTMSHMLLHACILTGVSVSSHKEDSVGFDDVLDEFGSCAVSMDHPFGPENRVLSQQLLLKPKFFPAGCDRHEPGVLRKNFMPAYSEDSYKGVLSETSNLNIPIPSGGRIRVSVVGNVSRVGSTRFTVTLTIKEELAA